MFRDFGDEDQRMISNHSEEWALAGPCACCHRYNPWLQGMVITCRCYYFPWPRVNCNVRAPVAGRPLAEEFKIWGDWSLYSRQFGISSVIIWLQMALRRQQVACMVCWTNPKQSCVEGQLLSSAAQHPPQWWTPPSRTMFVLQPHLTLRHNPSLPL